MNTASALHQFYTNECTKTGKKLQKSTTSIKLRSFIEFALTIDNAGEFQDFNGDLGGVRTPDLMLRRTPDSSKIPVKQAFFPKFTQIAHINQNSCGAFFESLLCNATGGNWGCATLTDRQLRSRIGINTIRGKTLRPRVG